MTRTPTPGTYGRVDDSAAAGLPAGQDLLEVHEADGAFELIEGWLRERGFFSPGGEALLADLYLGYGLSETIRRTRTQTPTRAVRAPARRMLRPTPRA